MISYIKGRYKICTPYEVIIETSDGVGYSIEMPLSSVCKLPPCGSEIELWIYTYVREDAIKLYGFLTYFEKLMFDILLSLNGVGPKVALAILSTLDIHHIERAINFSNQEIFETVPGVGPRLAEKILVELKSKIKKIRLAKQIEQKFLLNNVNCDLEQKESKKDKAVIKNTEYMEIAEDIISALENLGFKEKHVAPLVFDLCKNNPQDNFQHLLKKALVQIKGINENSVAKKEKTVNTNMTFATEDQVLQKDLF